MSPTAPTLRLGHARRALPAGISDADVRRLGLAVVTQPGRFVQRVSDVWLEQPIDDRWMAAYRIVTAGGPPRVAELRVFAIEPEFATRPPGEWSGAWRGVDAAAPRQGLTKGVVRRVALHKWTAQTRDILASWAQQVGPERAQSLAKVLGRFGPLPTPPRPVSRTGRGRPALSDEFYAQVAAEYVAALKAGQRPIKAIARHRGEPEARIRGWIHRARQRGLLEGRGQGQALGELSPRAIFILEAAKQSRAQRREKGGTRPGAKPGRRRAQTRRRP